MVGLFDNSGSNDNKKAKKRRSGNSTNKIKSYNNKNYQDVNLEIDILTNNDCMDKGTKLGLSKNHINILKNCQLESSAKELMAILERTNSTKFKVSIINPLLENNFLELKFPKSPKHPQQKYLVTGKFVRNKF